MADTNINFAELNMSEEELFSPLNHDELESEKIIAPRYSYWASVFRVFFKKKINIIVLSILAVLIIFAYVYPAVIHYDADIDPYINIMDSTTKHLNPAAAMEKFGGGGHQSMAACQLPDESIAAAVEKLNNAINEYFNQN